MVQHLRPTTKTQIRVVPRDGELVITLDINISVDGKVQASAENADVTVEDEDHVDHVVPEFVSELKLDFGKEDKDTQ